MYGRLYKAVCVCLYTVIMRRIGGAGAALVVRPPSHAAPCYRKAHYIWELTAGHLVCYSISIGFRNCEVLFIVTRWTCFKSDLMKPVRIPGVILVYSCSIRESVRIVRRMFRVTQAWATSTVHVVGARSSLCLLLFACHSKRLTRTCFKRMTMYFIVGGFSDLYNSKFRCHA